MNRYFLLSACTLFITACMSAQVTVAPSVLASGGGHGENGNINISWTLGELAVTTLKGENMMLTQGFQQPFEIEVGTHKENIGWGISVYPNPVGEKLHIRFHIENPGDFLLEIQDVTGRLICKEPQKHIYPGDIITLNTSSYTNGVYFLKIRTLDGMQVQVTCLNKL